MLVVNMIDASYDAILLQIHLIVVAIPSLILPDVPSWRLSIRHPLLCSQSVAGSCRQYSCGQMIGVTKRDKWKIKKHLRLSRKCLLFMVLREGNPLLIGLQHANIAGIITKKEPSNHTTRYAGVPAVYEWRT